MSRTGNTRQKSLSSGAAPTIERSSVVGGDLVWHTPSRTCQYLREIGRALKRQSGFRLETPERLPFIVENVKNRDQLRHLKNVGDLR